jgi:flagellar biogenesis protein FliO
MAPASHAAVATDTTQPSAENAATVAAREQSDLTSESQPLRISESEIPTVNARPAAGTTASSNASDLSRIAFALVSVIGLILLLRAVYRHLSAMPGVGRGSKLVTVVSRSILSPKQQVLVLSVGRRLLVVGDSGGQMNALCEISDPDEIASLMGQASGQRSVIARENAGLFRSVFRRANDRFGGGEIPVEPADNTGGEPEDAPAALGLNTGDEANSLEVGGLIDKVRMLQQQFHDARERAALLEPQNDVQPGSAHP